MNSATRTGNYARGYANPNWTGDAVTYEGIHQRLRRILGPAREYPCNDCRQPAAHWSYDHADPAERTSDLGAYSASIKHYVPRCVSCHKKHDLAFKPERPDAPIDLDAVRRLRTSGFGIAPIAKRLGTSRRRVVRAIDELELSRQAGTRANLQPRCDRPMRPWRGVVQFCSRAEGHAGKHEARRRPKSSLEPPMDAAS